MEICKAIPDTNWEKGWPMSVSNGIYRNAQLIWGTSRVPGGLLLLVNGEFPTRSVACAHYKVSRDKFR